MKRRKFITIISGFSLASIGGYITYPAFQEVVKKIILHTTSGLNLEENQIEIFLAEANTENYWSQFSVFKKEFIKAHYLLENAVVTIPYFTKYLQYKNKILGQFLLSTDFFMNKMDSRKKINYIGFYNPYKLSCGSPFSNLYYPVK